MVEVTYERTGDIVHFMMYGHAQYDYHGKDIVCAACTALTDTLLTLLIEKTEPTFVYMPGLVDINIDLNDMDPELRVMLHLYYDFCYRGLSEIAHEYPSNVIMITGAVATFL